ncbi:MAG: U32 family peptidase [Spirochaetia bacterium]|nr:U32 family peptidase [Spirochaetia bacterium]
MIGKSKVELLAPAGNFEKLKIALHYGADAVYAGGLKFSLRERSDNFTREEFAQAVKYTHSLNKKIYVAVNIYAHNHDIEELPSYISFLRDLGVDAIIFSDPGVFEIVREIAPDMQYHLSTQASTTNYRSVDFWKKQGVHRIILARELAYSEIKEIVSKSNIEIEMFVHGAQCMAYSGRCLISNYMTDRGANQGDCAQSCRWNYSLVEEKRPDEFHPVEEDSRGTYFFNSKDLSLIQSLPLVLDTGVHSIKIEGRVKTIHYVSTVVRAYRQALDICCEGRENNYEPSRLTEELRKISHRDYSTGFFFGNPGSEGQSTESSRPNKGMSFLGKIKEVNELNEALVEIRGKFSIGDTIEIMRRNIDDDFLQTVVQISDENKNPIEFTKPNTSAWVRFDKPVSANDILRMSDVTADHFLATK